MNQDLMIIFCDGASNPHTKRSGIGVVWFDPNYLSNPECGKTLMKNASPGFIISKEIYSGVANKYPTNNEAEYLSLIEALKYSVEQNIKQVNIFMDSKLVIEQVKGKWRINYPHLQKLKDIVDQYKTQIKFKLKHVKREYNKHADKASKDCFKQKCKFFDTWKS